MTQDFIDIKMCLNFSLITGWTLTNFAHWSHSAFRSLCFHQTSYQFIYWHNFVWFISSRAAHCPSTKKKKRKIEPFFFVYQTFKIKMTFKLINWWLIITSPIIHEQHKLSFESFEALQYFFFFLVQSRWLQVNNNNKNV